jgi:ABC-2 type transport system ATP-binding protein
MQAICVRDLRKSYGETPAVRGISFDVAAGEVFGLLGANGAGKTTTTVTLFASFYPNPRRVSETIELAGLGSKPDVLVGALSGGERRRVDVALGIVGDPDLLFLDEPTTGFDPSARRDAWNMIDGLRALGKTIVLTTHYMDEAQRLADRVAIMRGGELIATGTVDEIGRTLGSGVVVRFRLPTGVSGETVRAEVDCGFEVMFLELMTPEASHA